MKNLIQNASWELLYPEPGAPGPKASVRNTRAGVRIEIPARGSVNYVVSNQETGVLDPGTPLGDQVLVLSGTIRVLGEIRALDRKGQEGREPDFRPILLGDIQGDSRKWWSHSGIGLQESGPFRLEIPLHPSCWSQVWGKMADSSPTLQARWRQTAARCRVGVTFGGGNHYGHGVRSRPASFVQIDRVLVL